LPLEADSPDRGNVREADKRVAVSGEEKVGERQRTRMRWNQWSPHICGEHLISFGVTASTASPRGEALKTRRRYFRQPLRADMESAPTLARETVQIYAHTFGGTPSYSLCLF
ncbi:MAG: hypothetical protein IJU16_02070, partial [Clostridia bacterium]|nr:hypothetical protein [Clostridia bacterium]